MVCQNFLYAYEKAAYLQMEQRISDHFGKLSKS